jgi:ferredoxin
MAEDNFCMLDETAEVFKQPEFDYEFDECLEAMKACPIQAIVKY